MLSENFFFSTTSVEFPFSFLPPLFLFFKFVYFGGGPPQHQQSQLNAKLQRNS
jgi:hypothetical protein